MDIMPLYVLKYRTRLTLIRDGSLHSGAGRTGVSNALRWEAISPCLEPCSPCLDTCQYNGLDISTSIWYIEATAHRTRRPQYNYATKTGSDDPASDFTCKRIVFLERFTGRQDHSLQQAHLRVRCIVLGLLWVPRPRTAARNIAMIIVASVPQLLARWTV